MEIQAAPEVKYALIHKAVMKEDNLLKINKLCEIACVSRSGYYRWLASENTRKRREDNDRRDFKLILEAYRYRGYSKGVRGIHMRLLHDPGIIMNVKKIRRLMRKYGLFCPVRKANPYRQMARAMATSHVAPNVVNLDCTQKMDILKQEKRESFKLYPKKQRHQKRISLKQSIGLLLS